MLGLTKSIYLVCSVTVLMRTCLEKIVTARWTHMILLFTSSQLLCKSVSIIFWPRCSFYVFKYSQWISLPWIYLTSLSSSKLPSVQCHLARASTAYLYVWDWRNEWRDSWFSSIPLKSQVQSVPPDQPLKWQVYEMTVLQLELVFQTMEEVLSSQL